MLSLAKIRAVFMGKSGVEGEKLPGSGSEAKSMTPVEEAVDIAKTVLLAVAITLVFRIVAWQPFNIPSGSMRPNLLVGDFLIVSKFEYGYSKASLVYPFTRLPMEGRLFGSDPERGDVVVFKNKRDRNRDYIKRVIGMPGDKVQTINGTVYINGQLVEREFISEETVRCDAFSGRAKTYRETLPNGVSYMIQECYGNSARLDNIGPFTVPAGHFFMMGDNRDNSQDSRTSSVSYVAADQIVGKAERLVFSVDGNKSRIWTIWNWPSAVRFGRVFDPVK